MKRNISRVAFILLAVGLAITSWRYAYGPGLHNNSYGFVYRWGFIDKTGKWIVKPDLYHAGSFGEDLAPVTRSMGYHEFIDRSGKTVLKTQQYVCSGFHEGLALVATSKDLVKASYGYMDTSGKVVIRPQSGRRTNTKDGIDFSEGLCAVPGREKISGQGNGHRLGFMDKAGKMIIKPSFVDAHCFREGVAAVSVSGRGAGAEWGFIDRTGRFVIPPKPCCANSFSEGLALEAVATGTDGDGPWKCGYIDHSGHWVIKPTFDKGKDFSEGLAAVQIGDKWEFIDKSGQLRVALPSDVTDPGDFHDGLAKVRATNSAKERVRIDGPLQHHYEVWEVSKQGYIDKTGKLVIPCTFSDAGDFSRGLAPAAVNPCAKL